MLKRITRLGVLMLCALALTTALAVPVRALESPTALDLQAAFCYSVERRVAGVIDDLGAWKRHWNYAERLMKYVNQRGMVVERAPCLRR